MPSFDVVSKIDQHELNNALDQANREVGNRFDFKGSDARYTEAGGVITLDAESEFQLQQMIDILFSKISKRGIDLKALEALIAKGDYLETWKFIEQNIFSLK